jgi:SAM-dependent methyltransferase
VSIARRLRKSGATTRGGILRTVPRPHLGTRLSNLYWERRLGISSRGTEPVAHPDSVHYATLSYPVLWPILDHLALGPSDVFVDIGSGKGRVLCCAARYRVSQVVGVDLSEPLCAAARENARRMRGRRAPIAVHTATADALDYSDATVLFLFNPFGAATLAPLLERIGREASGSLRIAYPQPTHADVFERQPWLEQTAHWDATERDPAVAFYRSRL